ncbi:MAG: tetratricopeptide repeat protein, partial [Candidatus Nealsonbacteria bacterium]|nr:tetratricopeptide repeat protein [Candidatus Nealsonbacteria bacterium]
GHYGQGRWKMAVEEFRKFLDGFPNHAKADASVFLLAESLLQSNNREEAGKFYRTYLDRQPSGPYARAALFRAGEMAYLAGTAEPGSAAGSEDAVADLEQFRKKYPIDKLNAYVLPYLGNLALRKQDAATAAKYFQAGLDDFPKGRLASECRFGLARALEKQGKTREAAEFYRALAAETGTRFADVAQFRLGAMQYAFGEYAEAIRTFSAFETTMAASPQRPNARLGRGWALFKLQRWDEAAEVFASVAADSSVGVEAQYWLGLTQTKQDDWQTAAKTFAAAATAAGPQHKLAPDVRFHAGEALRQSGQPVAARRQYDLVLKSEVPGNKWLDQAALGKIRAAWDAEDYAAIEYEAAEFEKRFSGNPLIGDVHRVWARSLLQQKQYDAALKLLAPLVSAEKTDRQGLVDRYLLAQAYQGLNRHAEAIDLLVPITQSSEPSLKADAQSAQGSLLLAMQRYGEAVAPLEAFLASDPTGDAAVKGRGELAICYARSGQIDKAKQLHAELLEKHGEHALIEQITDHLAEAAYDANDAEWSRQLNRRLQAESRSPEYVLKGLAGQGWTQFKAGQLTEAAATFAELLEKDPPAELAAEAAMVRGQALEQLGREDPALAMYDLVVDKYAGAKQHPDALLAAARLRDKLQQDDRAAELYARLDKEYPEHAQAETVLYEWAWVLAELGKTAESSGLFERVRKEHSQGRYAADATYRLAQRAFAAKDFDGAAKLTAEVLAAAPDSEPGEHALYLQGQIYVVRQDWDRVRSTFEAFAKRFPNSRRRLAADYWIADVTYRRGQYEEAGKLLEQLAQLTRGRTDAWLAMIPLRRAQVLAQSKKWNEAYLIAFAIEANFPNFAQQHEADYLLGRCLQARAEMDAARRAYLKAIRSRAGEKTETAAMAQWMIGETYFHQQNYAAALREYLNLETLYKYPTWQAAALLQAGKCRELLGEPKEAAAHYARLLKLYGDTPFAERAAQQLKEISVTRSGSDRQD